MTRDELIAEAMLQVDCYPLHDKEIDQIKSMVDMTRSELRDLLTRAITKALDAAWTEAEKAVGTDLAGCMQECCKMGGGLGDIQKGTCRQCGWACASKRLLTARQVFEGK